MEVKQAVFAIEKASQNTIKYEQGDYYGEDGLLYCGKCHTPKQCRITILDEERTPMCLCKCMADKLEREEKERIHNYRVAKLREYGLPDAKMLDCTFDNDDRANQKITGILQRYTENFEKMIESGKGLTLFGNTGTGKTFLALCVANALIEREVACKVITSPQIVSEISDADNQQEYITRLNRYKLLVLDDLNAERNTDYANEIIYNVIDCRCRAGLPIIITTNATADDLKNQSDMRKARIYSRLFQMTFPIEISGCDRRRKNLISDYTKLSDVLGLGDNNESKL